MQCCVLAEARECARLGQGLQLVLVKSAPPGDVRDVPEGRLIHGRFQPRPVSFSQAPDVAKTHADRELHGFRIDVPITDRATRSGR